MADREKLLLDLFTEIAVVEHLVRNHLGTIEKSDLTAAQFGALNYFIRNNRERERKAILAWMFQVTIDEMDVHLGALEQHGLIGRIDDGDDQIIGITAAGRSAHAEAVSRMAPEIEPLMSEFQDEDLEKTVQVLQEIRRVFDNLPERAAASA
jgi:DNA-binding MarR family transcriptional regulator